VANHYPHVDAELRAAYLERLGLEAEVPSVDALRRLHERHVERVPYETLWIHGGETWDIDVGAALSRIAQRGRGGYCFHLNGAFSALLHSLGYKVTRHVGGVHGPDGPDAGALTNHLVLSVSDLPSAENPSGIWYVDVGLGDALHSPLPLIAGVYEQGPFRLVLDRTPGDVGDWHLTHDPAGSFPGMSWRNDEAVMQQFAERHRFLSTSADSGFVHLVAVQRRDATGVDILRGLLLTRVGDGTAPTEPLNERDDWFAALADVFGLHLPGVDASTRDRLWETTLAKHRAWEASTQPS
jgi:N-hydroxyarylamine O-acetyltransferase